MSIFRNVLCWAMITIFPVSLLAGDAGPAILHTQGGVLVNGREAADSTAIMPGDLLETYLGAVANLTTDGSTVVIHEQSIVKYNGDSLSLEHGNVAVGTSKSMSVNIDCLRVVPVSNDWTQYEVTDLDGQVRVAAIKLDVNIVRGISMRKPAAASTGSESGTVHEGQQATRDEFQACGAAKPAAGTTAVNTKWIEIGAAAGGGGILLCLLLCSGKQPPKTSPDSP